ncbi:NAD(P)H-binding protein [Frankia sp. AiPs1]|uniref:NAD(P)-dependent oxidoreductase n=1 Tax=Frankia sp. AiPs1 TaxID=573493 RepID=UPI00204325CD|nr:NAD(P)H-binding protein [Frankia sp. AiPs1]MCM3922354.1 NAD(P)H-binding protein [Frankia sp. AiPs1]
MTDNSTGARPAEAVSRSDTPARVAVLGAGGRAGRAVSQEFVARGHRVTGVVRDAGRHRSLGDLGVEVAEGNATRAGDLVDVLRDADIVVVAVTPFSAPPPSFDGFDEAFYEHVVAGVAGAVGAARTSPVTRLITIGLFATLTLTDGTTVMDDPDVFPPSLLPFARAHAREMTALRRLAADLDWLVLTPPAGLQVGDAADAAGYVLAALPLDRGRAEGTLGYGQLARAVADQAETPTLHQTQVAVLPTAQETTEERPAESRARPPA